MSHWMVSQWIRSSWSLIFTDACPLRLPCRLHGGQLLCELVSVGDEESDDEDNDEAASSDPDALASSQGSTDALDASLPARPSSDASEVQGETSVRSRTSFHWWLY
jgi:hypothetical protein